MERPMEVATLQGITELLVKSKLKIIFFITLTLFLLSCSKKGKDMITFATVSVPSSSDPLDYDLYIHHYAFASVFAKLVSSEKNGEYFPQIAESWRHDNNFKTWRFKIKDNLTFSNGDKITPLDILLTFNRLVFLKKKKNSNSGLLEFLDGFHEIKSIKSGIKGISIDNDEIIFSFIKPLPKMLSLISFGFYGIVHTSQYNSITGEWIKNNTTISSNSYKVSKWTNSEFELELRKDTKLINPNDRIKKIKFVDIFKIASNESFLKDIDIIVADKKSLIVSDNFKYIGSTENLKIGYVRCLNWDNLKHPFHNLEVRKWLRFKFYEELSKHLPLNTSFFPPTLSGLTKTNFEYKYDKPNFTSFSVKTHALHPSPKIEEKKNLLSVGEIFERSLKNIGNNSGVTIELRPDEESDSFDLYITGTGIESDDYMDTVKFMFLSKEGIKLPDSNGKILDELKKDNPNINFINQEIFDQAIIWPIRHYTSGFWFRKDSGIDYSDINFDSPAIDFQFLKLK